MESEALQALFAHVSSLPTVPVYWPNVSDQASSQPTGDHYRVSILRPDPDTFGMCGESTYMWILQVAIYIRDGVGSIKAAEFADAIRAALPFDTRLVTANHVFKTTEVCNVISPLRVDGWYITPVQCRFITID